MIRRGLIGRGLVIRRGLIGHGLIRRGLIDHIQAIVGHGQFFLWPNWAKSNWARSDFGCTLFYSLGVSWFSFVALKRKFYIVLFYVICLIHIMQAYVYQKVFNNCYSKICKSVQTTQVKIVKSK